VSWFVVLPAQVAVQTVLPLVLADASWIECWEA
jgi:hypothetical protein